MKKLFNLLKESQHMDYRRLNIGEEDLDDTKMTNEEKRAFIEAVASYRKIGEAIYHNGNLMEAYQNIKKIVETAHKLTLQETGDWFDKVTVSRHMKSMNESFKIFTNTIKEVSTLQQRLESSYDEIGEILGKYYEIKEGNEFGAERARAIAAGEDTFQVGDKTFKVTDVDSEDKENAQNFVGENMKLSQLINKKSINEEFKHIIHVDTPTQIVSKSVAAQIMALAKKGIPSKEIGLEMGFVGNTKLAADTFQKVKNRIYFDLDKRESVVTEGKYDATLDKIEAAVKNASSFMNIGAELKKAGIKYDFSTEMIAMYSIKVPGNTIAIVNKKYVDGAEREVGNYAIGLMEGKNLVKEIAIRKGTRIRSYIDGRTYTVDYEVVDTKHFSLRYGGGTTNLLKVINSNHPKIKVGSTEEFSTGDLKKSISAGIKTIIKESYIGEAKKPKFGDTVHLKSQNKTGMVYSVKGNEVVIRTVSGLVKGKLSDAEIVMDEGNEFGAERARAIAAGEDTFTVGGKTYKVTDVDPQDKENAKDFVGEMKLSNFIKKSVKESTDELPKATIPSTISARLEQIINKLKDSTLTYNQKLQILGRLVDGMGVDKSEFSRLSTKLRGVAESTNLKKKVNEANVKLSDLLKGVVDGSTSRVGSTKVDKKTAEKLLKLYKVGDVAMQNKFDKMTADKVISAFKPFMENKKVTNEVSPEGWEKTVKAMKDEPGIDNPWALAWWMKGKGYQSHKK